MSDKQYEFWEAELKDQSKKRLALLDRAIAKTGSAITDRDEDIIFTDPKLKWRNPVLLKIKVPARKRYEFILEAKVWLFEPPQVQKLYDPTNPDDLPRIRLRSNHDNAKRRRNYRFHPHGHEYIADYRPELNGEAEFFKGAEILAAVLNGELDLLSRSPQ
jgi:hypothetical protein